MRPFVIAALSPTQPPIGLVIPAQGRPPRRRGRGSRASKCAQRGARFQPAWAPMRDALGPRPRLRGGRPFAGTTRKYPARHDMKRSICP
jgi:hypothetical protein